MNQVLNVIESNKIPGLYVVQLDQRNDDRGWFKENYQKQKLEALGLPHLNIVQNNFSFNKEVGVTRGIHAEPWDKYVSLATGRIFVAYVDLRAGDNFGAIESLELSTDKAVFVPRGCGNSYQTLEANTAYTYLVNDYWRAEATYRAVNLADKSLDISWPIPLEEAILSAKDQKNPLLKQITPYAPEEL